MKPNNNAMRPRFLIRFLAALYALVCLSWLPVEAQSVEASISSRYLVRGETAVFEVLVAEGQPNAAPVIPSIPDVAVRSEGLGMPRTRILPGRAMGYAFEFSVTSTVVGKHVIPAIDMEVSGVPLRTEPVEFEVVPAERLTWREVPLGNGLLRYATLFATSNNQPFANQTVPVELKVYVPGGERIEEWGIPDFDREGLNVWRFEPNRQSGSAILNGASYLSVAYPSTLTPTRAGKVTLGPGKLRLVTIQTVPDVFGFRPVYQAAQLEIGALELNARELPAGAPLGFEQTVGSFTLSASVEETQLAAGDPANVKLTVKGRGNLDSVRVPKLIDANGWKLYDAVAQPRGQERRNLSGEVSFTQLIRPLQPKTLIPPFRLVYFDPDEETYKTLLTEPIKLQMAPAPPSAGSTAGPAVQARPVPGEQLGDILGLIDVRVSERRGWLATLPAWSWQAVPAALALVLLVGHFGPRVAARLARDPHVQARKAALREVERAPADAPGFYRAAGRFIEARLGGDPSPELGAILAKRDSLCFKPDAHADKLPAAERRAVLRTLRQHLLGILAGMLAVAGLTGEARAANATEAYQSAASAYQRGQFAEAAKEFATAGHGTYPADALYNIGNCYYRLDQPGYAALFYRRALAAEPQHPEAQQNLRFLEKTQGSLVVPHSETELLAGRLGLATWQFITQLGGWLVLLGLLGVWLTRPGSVCKPVAVASLVIGPVAAALGALGWASYPDDARFAPVERQVVIVAAETTVRTAASRTAKEVIQAPPGSLAEVLATRGEWTYIGFASKTRGWVPSDAVEPVAIRGKLELKNLVRGTPPSEPKLIPGA